MTTGKQFTEAELPVEIHHEDLVTLADGTTVRFETNAEAKDIYIGDAFTPNIQLFPGTEFEFQAGGADYKCTATFEDNVRVEKL